jgi:hypothetical protein
MRKTVLIASTLMMLGVSNCASEPLGEASCRVSARGSCPEIANMTFYVRQSGDIVYYHPDGRILTVGGGASSVRVGSWQVTKEGTQWISQYPFVGRLPPAPLSALRTHSEPHAGDPANVAGKSKNMYIQPEDKRPFSVIAREVAAR